MQDDPTLDVNLTRALEESKRLADSIKPGSDRWDVIVVGSGAAGGMAAFQLAMAGVKVLLLEAGRMIDVKTEYRTMEWPYASMRRGRLPPGERPIDVAEYSFLDRPYGSNPAFEKHKKVTSYAANTFTRNWVVDERQHPTTGTPYSWVRSHILGGKTNFWGRGALRYGPLQFNAASRDGFDVDWPISYDDVKPYYDKVDVLLGCSGTIEGLEQVPDGVFQRPYKLNCVEVAFKRAIAKMGRHYIPGRAGVTTDGVLNKYRAKCAGRGRCGRGFNINAAFHSPTALIYPARDTGNVTIRPYSLVSEVLVDAATNTATGVRVIDANTREVFDFTARVRNITDRHPDFIRGYHFQGGGGCAEYPSMAHETPGYGKAFKSNVRKHYPAIISFGGFGEVLPRKENRVTLDPQVKDAWGIPVLRFDYRFRDNELRMAKDMADSIEEMLMVAGAEDIKVEREPLPPGWSIHEIGTARMGDDPKTSVTDRFCRLHDVKNVYLADASPFVCGGTQNTTWSILAMAWRTMDYLKDRLRAGDV